MTNITWNESLNNRCLDKGKTKVNIQINKNTSYNYPHVSTSIDGSIGQALVHPNTRSKIQVKTTKLLLVYP